MLSYLEKAPALTEERKRELFSFTESLGLSFDDYRLLNLAFTHTSYANECKGKVDNNERLEFLGDAILDAVVADIVYKKFEGKREGFLTNTRSKIVQRETLNNIAINIGLDKLIKYSSKQSSHNSYMSGNAFEALIGAIYLDRGYRACKKFMEERIIGQYINIDKISRKEVNFKSKLIEWSQKNKFEIEFKLIGQTLDEHQNPIFETQIMVEGIPGGSGKGYSKKESQQEAAHATMTMIKKDSIFIDAIFNAKHERENLEKPVAFSETGDAVTNADEQDFGPMEEKFRDEEKIIAEAENAAFSQEKD